jgi:hypothetical protein
MANIKPKVGGISTIEPQENLPYDACTIKSWTPFENLNLDSAVCRTCAITEDNI